jgi:hypothetical protein
MHWPDYLLLCLELEEKKQVGNSEGYVLAALNIFKKAQSR